MKLAWWQKLLYILGAPILYVLATIEPPSMYFIRKENVVDAWRDNYNTLNEFYKHDLWQ